MSHKVESVRRGAGFGPVSPERASDIALADEGSPTPAVEFGRMKAPPVCSVPSLQKESISSMELSKMCFPRGEVTGLTYSSSSSTASIASTSYQIEDLPAPGGARNVTFVEEKKTISTTEEETSGNDSLNAKIRMRTTSRQGRSSQRWVFDPKINQRVRLVVGCVPIMKDGRILFVSSSRKTQWILPKGGWEMDETAEESAIRETFEEAGVLGTLGPKLCEVEYETRKAKKRRKEWEETLRKKKERLDLDVSATLALAVESSHSSEDEQHPKNTPLSDPGNMGEMGPPPLSPVKLTEESVAMSTKCAEENSTEISSGIVIPRSSSTTCEETASVASSEGGSSSYAFVRMQLYILYVSDVKEEWPERGRARKVVDIDEAIAMLESRPEFRVPLMEVRERGLHLVNASKSDQQSSS
eukprot:scaffold5747_cov57-Attheya_sp.AAC.1